MYNTYQENLSVSDPITENQGVLAIKAGLAMTTGVLWAKIISPKTSDQVFLLVKEIFKFFCHVCTKSNIKVDELEQRFYINCENEEAYISKLNHWAGNIVEGQEIMDQFNLENFFSYFLAYCDYLNIKIDQFKN